MKNIWPVIAWSLICCIVAIVFLFVIKERKEKDHTYRVCDTGFFSHCFYGDKLEKVDNCAVLEGKGAVCGNYTVEKLK